MGRFSHPTSKRGPASPGPARIKTTLYEVIDAVGNAVEGKEERLVPEIVAHLVNSGMVKFTGEKADIFTR